MADVLSRLPFAKAHEQEQSTILNNSLDNTSLDAKLTGPRLLDIPRTPCLCELKSNGDSDEETQWHDDSESSESERELEEDLIELEPEIQDENCKLPQSNSSLEITIPIVDLPISRDGITAQDVIVPTSEEFEKAQKEDTELNILRIWIEEKRAFSED